MLNIGNRNAINSQRGGLTGLSKIFSDYGFLNMWSSENRTISGTDTTFHDYGGEHDLSNPAATNQPTLNSADANFNGIDSFTFATDDYVYKSVSDWRSLDSGGIKVSVFLRNSGTITFLATADEGGTTDYMYSAVNTNSYREIIRSSSTVNSFRGSTVIDDGNAHVVQSGSKGSSFVMNIDQNDETITVISGTDNGDWMDSILNRDNITVGALIYGGSPIYSNIDWAMSGYLPYTDVATMNSLAAELKTYYGI